MGMRIDEVESKWLHIECLNDLNWDLGAITNRREAIEFLQQFENKFCIYSPYVEKLYSSYSFVIPNVEDCGQVTVLPDPYSFHDTFQGVCRHAVEETGIHIYPGETSGKHGLIMKIPSPRKIASSRELPFAEGVRTIIKEWRAQGRMFLPVLQNGDLREFEDRMPSLHLHVINHEKLNEELSDLTIRSIRNVVADNLLDLFRTFGG